MNKVLADILERPVPKGLTVSKTQILIKKVEEIDTNPKLIYSAGGEKILKELNEYGAKDIPQNYRGVLLEHWLELLSQGEETITEIPRPTGPEATTLTSDQLEDLGEYRDEQKRKYDQTVKNQKEAVAKFKEAGEKRYQDQQKEKQTQDLLNQFFKSKVVVVPTEEIPEVKLSKENKETLIAAEMAAKEDPATTKKIFEEKIQEALNNSDQEYKNSITKETIEKSAVHLVETLRNLPDHKNIEEISDSPKSLNTLSILNPLSDPNSEEMKKIIPDKEAREKFAKEVQTLMLTTEAERTVNLAGAKAIFGENIAYSLYGTDTITDFQISSEEKDREEGVEISPRDVYEKGKQVSDFINKVKGFRNAEEVTSTGLAYYPTYSYSNAAVATKTASVLTKALPAVGAVYGFKQGLILSQWARSGTPLLSAGNQNLVRLLTSQAGVQEIASASMVTFSNPIGFQLGKFSIGIATGANQATGTQIAMGGIRFGEKMAGAIAVKGGTQVAIVTGTQAGAQLAVGTSTLLTKALTLIGGLGSWATAGLSLAGGYLLGKVIEKLPQIKKWFSENGWIFGVGAGVGGMMIGGPVAGVFGLGLGLAAVGSLGTFAAGAFGVLGFIGRSIGIAIATPVIITLLVIPPLVAFIMLVINNSAYVVPPGSNLSSIGADNPYMLVTKTAIPTKIGNPSGSSTVQVTYMVSIRALKENLVNIKIVSSKCSVVTKDRSIACPPEDIPTLEPTLSVSPTSPYTFTFYGEYDSNYRDSLIFDSVTVSAETSSGEQVTTTGSATVCIGDCPTDCVKTEDFAQKWPTNLRNNADTALGKLSGEYQGFMSKVCSKNETLGLCYAPNQIDEGYYAWHIDNAYGDNCDVYFNEKGLQSETDALFMITHELSHHVQNIYGGWDNEYENSGAWNEVSRGGFCTYSDTAGSKTESMAEANALFTNSKPSWDACAANYKGKYPKNYMFAEKFMR